jgi:hypothetical protein
MTGAGRAIFSIVAEPGDERTLASSVAGWCRQRSVAGDATARTDNSHARQAIEASSLFASQQSPHRA